MFDGGGKTLGGNGGGSSLPMVACGFSPSSWRGDSTPTVDGSLHAAVSSDGIPFLTFVGPDGSFQFAASRVAEARVVGGLVKALEVQIDNDNGSHFIVSFTGPIERMKKMLAECGIWMIF